MPSLDVIATDRGYYNQIREEGDPFTLEDSRLYSPRWMEPAKDDAKSRKLIEEAEEYQRSRRPRTDTEIMAAEIERLKRELDEKAA